MQPRREEGKKGMVHGLEKEKMLHWGALHAREWPKLARGERFQKCAFIVGEVDGHSCKQGLVGELKMMPKGGPRHGYEGAASLAQEGECVCVCVCVCEELPL